MPKRGRNADDRRPKLVSVVEDGERKRQRVAGLPDRDDVRKRLRERAYARSASVRPSSGASAFGDPKRRLAPPTRSAPVTP
jgi:hypothetical protein